MGEAARRIISFRHGRPVQAGKPVVLYGPDNAPLAPTQPVGQIRRTAATRGGSLSNWNPRRIASRMEEARDRAAIVDRCLDLAANDPNAAGVLHAFAVQAIGGGLSPMPMAAANLLGIERAEAQGIKREMLRVLARWMPAADAGRRWSFPQLEYLIFSSLLRYGEYLVLLPMIDDPSRPYALAVQVISPLRLKTPRDLINASNIREGIEIGDYGEPVAYWIKKTATGNAYSSAADTSNNFVRIPARNGHRRLVLHDFFAAEPEAVRGLPILTPAVKFFRDLSDYLDAELASNVIAAGLSVFIEVGTPEVDALYPAQTLADYTRQEASADGTTRDARYQEIDPGSIMYGQPGEKPHIISGQRPGVTFEPFTRTIKKALSMGIGIPYPVAFQDVEGLNFAGYRAALLSAWKTFKLYRQWFGNGFLQPIFAMLIEEAYLRGELSIKNLYDDLPLYTAATWHGEPKGDLEPITSTKADILAIANNLKTRSQVLAENQMDFFSIIETLAEEEEALREKGLRPGMDDTPGDAGVTETTERAKAD